MAASIHSDDGDLGFQIAPMVDVVFVLMLFFMACAFFQDKEFWLESSVGGQYPNTSQVSIDVTVAADGSVFLQDRLVAGPDDRKVAALGEWLKAMRAKFGGADPLVIAPAPTVSHERVMQVLNAVNAAEWKKVSFR